jgi:hypothetical protein
MSSGKKTTRNANDLGVGLLCMWPLVLDIYGVLQNRQNVDPRETLHSHPRLETLFTSATAPNERQSYSHKVRIGQRLIPKNYIQKEKLLSSSESSCVFINFRVSMCVCVYLHECSEPLKKFYILIVPNGSNQQRLNQYNCM